MRRFFGVAFLAMLAFGGPEVEAQQAASERQSQYCAKAGGDMTLGTIQPQQEEKIYRLCHVGDVVYIPAKWTVTIGRVCDFTQQIVVQSGGTVLCILGPLRPIRPWQ